MEFSEYLGREMHSDGGTVLYVAYIAEDGITFKTLESDEDAWCLNVNRHHLMRINGSFEDHFDFALNVIESGVWLQWDEVLDFWGYKQTTGGRLDDRFCNSGVCITGDDNG